MAHSEYPTAEIVRRGRDVYDTNIRDQVEAEHHGKFLAVDILTGHSEIADDDVTASDRVIAKNPDGVLYVLRVGYPVAYRLGARSLVKQP